MLSDAGPRSPLHGATERYGASSSCTGMARRECCCARLAGAGTHLDFCPLHGPVRCLQPRNRPSKSAPWHQWSAQANTGTVSHHQVRTEWAKKDEPSNIQPVLHQPVQCQPPASTGPSQEYSAIAQSLSGTRTCRMRACTQPWLSLASCSRKQLPF